jgi:DNA mismatch repair protein MutS2
MTNSFTHAVEALELPSLLDHIAAKCTNDPAADAIRSLRPTASHEAIDRSLAEIDELVRFHETHGRLPVADTHAQQAIRRSLDSGEPVDAAGMLDIAASERTGADVVQRLQGEENFARLSDIAAGISPQYDLIKNIERCIERDGSIKDKATRRLASLRRDVLSARESLRNFTDRLAKSFGSIEYATYSGHRYMLVVPRDKVRRKDGLVHSTSHSGGSLYFEPFTLLEKNNDLEALLADVHAEEARILAELNGSVMASSEVLLENFSVLDRLDALDAKARFAREFRCNRPDVTEGVIRLKTARHPLLEISLREGGGAPVPLDVTLDERERVLVITGPNAGGKTVTLKTVGLIVLMHQCGLPVPCDAGSTVSVFERVFADIGDEQSIATSLSTFTSHLRHLDAMCRGADDRTLCLVDEIGDGTDPDEGTALAIAALEHLLGVGAMVIATTHYGKIKTFALDTNGVSNASMLFDDEGDAPLYRLMQGMAGRSRGLDTARRLGFVKEIVGRAVDLMGQDAFRLETLLGELERSRLALEREQRDLEEERRALDEITTSYNTRERDLREHRAAHEARARREAEDIVVRARREIEGIVKNIRESQASKSAVREGHDRLASLLDDVASKPEPTPPDRPKAQGVRVGDRVSLSPTGSPAGVVVDIRRKQVTVDINGKTITASVNKLYAVAPDARGHGRKIDVDVSVTPMEGTSLDVRGSEREEALAEVDRFLDSAVLNGVGEVTVIHGIGEEVLLKAIRSRLDKDPRVASVREGSIVEGGRGVTVVGLK